MRRHTLEQDSLTYLVVFLGHAVGKHGLFHEKSVVCVSSRVGLGLKESIKVPERTLHPLVCRHLFEPHFHQNAPKFCSHLSIICQGRAGQGKAREGSVGQGGSEKRRDW